MGGIVSGLKSKPKQVPIPQRTTAATPSTCGQSIATTQNISGQNNANSGDRSVRETSSDTFVAPSTRPPRHPNSTFTESGVPAAAATPLRMSHVASNDQIARLLIDSGGASSSLASTPRALPSNSTPGREETMRSCIPQTPIDKESTSYKYYCPLCMCYFKDIFKVLCCDHYTCFQCALEYLNSKGVEAVSARDILSNHEIFKTISCPHCNSVGFRPQMITLKETPRDYSMGSTKENTNVYASSPVRIGDSFADLKRKMISYDNASARNDDSTASPGSTDSQDNKESVIVSLVSIERQQAVQFVRSLFSGIP